ncbi:MAG: hypothetical protein WCA29_08320 [Jiangellales bacterium]
MYMEIVMMAVRPEDAALFLARRDAAMAAIRERFPELSTATLVRLDERRWVDWVEWASAEQAHAAAEAAPGIEAVAEWFGVIEAVESMQHGQVVHRFGPDSAAAVGADG